MTKSKLIHNKVVMHKKGQTTVTLYHDKQSTLSTPTKKTKKNKNKNTE